MRRLHSGQDQRDDSRGNDCSQRSTCQTDAGDPFDNAGLQTFDAGSRGQVFIGAFEPCQPFSMVCCSCHGGVFFTLGCDQVFVAQRLADNKQAQARHTLWAAAGTDPAGCRGGYQRNRLGTAVQQVRWYRVFVTASWSGVRPIPGSQSSEGGPGGNIPGAKQFDPCCDQQPAQRDRGRHSCIRSPLPWVQQGRKGQALGRRGSGNRLAG